MKIRKGTRVYKLAVEQILEIMTRISRHDNKDKIKSTIATWNRFDIVKEKICKLEDNFDEIIQNAEHRDVKVKNMTEVKDTKQVLKYIEVNIQRYTILPRVSEGKKIEGGKIISKDIAAE